MSSDRRLLFNFADTYMCEERIAIDNYIYYIRRPALSQMGSREECVKLYISPGEELLTTQTIDMGKNGERINISSYLVF